MSRKTRKRRSRRAHVEETTREKAKRVYAQSRKRFRHDDFDGAFQAIAEVLELDPGYPNAQNFAGWILLHLPHPTRAQLERALGHFREAMHVGPRDAVPALNAGEALVALGREDEAIALMESLTPDKHFKASALNWLGAYWALRKGDEDRGLELFEQATQAKRWSAKAWVNLGILKQRRGARSEACFAYQVALCCRDVDDKPALERKVAELESEMRQCGEEPPIVIRLMNGEIAGPGIVAIERDIRAGRYEDAIAAFESLSVPELVDAMYVAEAGAEAAYAGGHFAAARHLMEIAIGAYEVFASSASSGAEGLGRMAEIRRMREQLDGWGV